MEKMSQQALIAQLTQEVNQVITSVNEFRSHSFEALNWKSNPESWSVLECLEHLNYYSDYYLKQIDKVLKTGLQKRKHDELYTASWLGNYFTSMLKPNTGKKMNTLKRMNPVNSNLTISTIHTFLKDQERLLKAMEEGQSTDLKKIKVPLEFLPLIRLRLGDVFRFLVAHEQRHVLQAQNVLKKYEQQAVKNLS